MFRRIVAPQVLRYAIPGLGNVWQLVLKESALISVTGPRRAPAPVADRRRLDPPAVRLLHHRGGALPPHHLGLDGAVPEGRDPLAARRPEGGLMDLAFMGRPSWRLLEGLPLTLNLAFTSVALGAVLAMLLALMRMSGVAGARLDRARLRVRVPRHAAARADLPDLLRPRPVPPDPAGLGPVGASSASPIGAPSWR